jgi:hypothetical protein
MAGQRGDRTPDAGFRRIDAGRIRPALHLVLMALLLLGSVARSSPTAVAAQGREATPAPSPCWPVPPSPTTPLMPEVLLLGTGSNGVYASMDSGLTWYPAKTGLPGGVWQVVADPERPGAAYVAAGDLYYATNHQRAWERVPLPPSVRDPGYTALATLDSTLYAVGPSGVLTSNDGRHWTLRYPAPWSSAPRQLLVDQDGIYALGADGTLFYAAAAGQELQPPAIHYPSEVQSHAILTLGYCRASSSKSELYPALADGRVCYMQHWECANVRAPGSGMVRVLLATD